MNSPTSWTPNKWVAGLLGVLAFPFGLFYVARPLWAIGYFCLLVTGLLMARVYAGRENEELSAGLVVLVAYAASIAHVIWFAARYRRAVRPAYSRWYGLLAIAATYVVFVFTVRAFVAEPFRMPAGSMLPTFRIGTNLIVIKWGYGNYGSYGVKLMSRPITAELKRGDIVVFEFPVDRDRHFVKRLIGLPGDRVIYKDKKLTINGKAVQTRDAGTVTDVSVSGLIQYLQYAETLDAGEHKVLVNPDRPPYLGDANRAGLEHQRKCTFESSGLSCEVPAAHYFVLGDNRDNSDDSRYWGFVPADAIVGKVRWVY
jgi:signal peptidase I